MKIVIYLVSTLVAIWLTPKIIFLIKTLISLFQIKHGKGVRDSEGKYYKTVIIGNQEWLKSNLKVSKFNNGENIPEVTTYKDWVNAYKSKSPAFIKWEGKNPEYFYNYYCLIDSRGIAPVGFHIPSYDSWVLLIENTGGFDSAARRLKTINGWEETKVYSYNTSGFSGFPNGFADIKENGMFSMYGSGCYWWSIEGGRFQFSTLHNEVGYYDDEEKKAEIKDKDKLKGIELGNGYTIREHGYSIRCVKD